MINPNNNSKKIIVFISALFLLLFCFLLILNSYKNRLRTLLESQHSIELKNALLVKEKAKLELEINKYVHFSDSVNKVIESNNKITNEKIKSLIQLTNDELRKIAND